MGTWGAGLYENDIAQDCLYAFAAYIKQYPSPEEALLRFQADHSAELCDLEDGPILTAVLADMLHNEGVQNNEVIEKTISWVEQSGDLNLWGAPASLNYQLREEALLALKDRLLSESVPQSSAPKAKKKQWIWTRGEVFALPLTCEYAKSIGKDGCYLLFIPAQNVAEFEGYLVPRVYVKITESGILPSTAEQINRLPFVIVSLTKYSERFRPFSCEEEMPEVFRQEYHCDKWGYLRGYSTEMLQAAGCHPPKELISIGVFEDLASPTYEYHRYMSDFSVAWKYAEEGLLNRYWLYNLRNAEYLKAEEAEHSENTGSKSTGSIRGRFSD